MILPPFFLKHHLFIFSSLSEGVKGSHSCFLKGDIENSFFRTPDFQSVFWISRVSPVSSDLLASSTMLAPNDCLYSTWVSSTDRQECLGLADYSCSYLHSAGYRWACSISVGSLLRAVTYLLPPSGNTIVFASLLSQFSEPTKVKAILQTLPFRTPPCCSSSPRMRLSSVYWQLWLQTYQV